MTSSQPKIHIRPLPHLDFIAGYPGIPEARNRTAAYITGNVEVRGKGLKAAWLRIELRKLESVPGGENWGELIGRGPMDIWSARPGRGDGDREEDAEGGKWEVLQNAEFPFKIPVPEGLPPTARVEKQCGISYELVASLCVRGKKGLLRNTVTSSIIQSTHPIVIEKHELHSTWPIYSIPDEHVAEADGVKARIERDQTCYGPGDLVKMRVYLFSNKVSPVKVKSVAFSLRETVTYRGGAKPGKRMSVIGGDGKAPASQRTEMIAAKSARGKKLYKGEEQEYELVCQVPKGHSLMTISTAKHIEVSYTLRLFVDISKNPIVIDHLPVTVTTFTRAQSSSLVPRIGYVPMLDPGDGESRAALSRSMSLSSGTNTQIGGWNPSLRRKDTQMTQASSSTGPGMAGRGIPGQLFSWGSQGGVGNIYPPNSGSVRPAFAGPPSIYEGRELTEEENRALFHHTNNVEQVAAFGLDPAAVASGSAGLGEHRYEAAHSRMMSSIAEQPGAQQQGWENPEWQAQQAHAMQPQLSQQQQMPPGAWRGSPVLEDRYASPGVGRPSPAPTPVPVPMPAPVPSATPSQGMGMPANPAEEEKMRLYERARMQAERNQRLADERRNQLAAASLPPGSSGLAPSSSMDAFAGASGSGSAGRSSSVPPQSQRVVSAPVPTPGASGSTPVAYPSAADEKQALYLRARKEAERYQSGFEQGASFPQEELHSSGSVSPAGANRNSLAPTPSPAMAPDAGSRRGSSMYWMGSQSGAGSSSSLGARPPMVASGSSSSLGGAPLKQTTSGASATAGPSLAMLSAEEEKKLLYERAKAEAESHQRSGSASQIDMGSSSASRAGPQAYETAPLPIYHRVTTSNVDLPSVTSALGGVSIGGTPASSRPVSSGALIESSLSAPTSAPVPGGGAISEKEQLRLYYAARDAQQRVESTANAAGVAAASSSASGSGAGSSAQAGPSASGASQMPSASGSSSALAGPSGSATPARVAASPLPGALSEKEQMRLYYAARDAQAEADAKAAAAGSALASGSGAGGSAAAASGSGSGWQQQQQQQVPPPAVAGPSSQPPSAAPPLPGGTAISEKEQLRLYYAARDAQRNSEQAADALGTSRAASTAPPLGHAGPLAVPSPSKAPASLMLAGPSGSGSQSPSIARPSPSYANGYRGPSGTPPSGASVGPPIPPKLAPTQNGIAAAQASSASAAPPFLAPLSFETRPISPVSPFGVGGAGPSSGVSPSGAASQWAPQAPQPWGADSAAGPSVGPSSQANAGPPPLPPKTVIK